MGCDTKQHVQRWLHAKDGLPQWMVRDGGRGLQNQPTHNALHRAGATLYHTPEPAERPCAAAPA